MSKRPFHKRPERPREAPTPLEHPLQASVCDALKLLLPVDCFLSAIPGGDRQVTLTPGYESGTPDLLLVWRGRAIFIEMKRAKGVVSEDQEKIHKRITLAGGLVATCRSLGDVMQFLVMIGIPMRGRVSA